MDRCVSLDFFGRFSWKTGRDIHRIIPMGAALKLESFKLSDERSLFSEHCHRTEYHYDALGRRVAKAILNGAASFTQTYLHLGQEDRILLGKAGNGSKTLYLDGQGVDEHFGEIKGSVAKAYLTDHLGSILNSDIAGTARGFGLFGESTMSPSISDSTNPVIYGFTGREFDVESGLNYHRARTYNSSLGRWLSQDLIGFASKDLNYYRYVFNNPILFNDPSGLKCNQAIGLGTGIMAFGAFVSYWHPVAGCTIVAIGGVTMLTGFVVDCPDDPPPPSSGKPNEQQTTPNPNNDPPADIFNTRRVENDDGSTSVIIDEGPSIDNEN